jgi:antitoxin component of MazEF toxin-antitoxin module
MKMGNTTKLNKLVSSLSKDSVNLENNDSSEETSAKEVDIELINSSNRIEDKKEFNLDEEDLNSEIGTEKNELILEVQKWGNSHIMRFEKADRIYLDIKVGDYVHIKDFDIIKAKDVGNFMNSKEESKYAAKSHPRNVKIENIEEEENNYA